MKVHPDDRLSSGVNLYHDRFSQYPHSIILLSSRKLKVPEHYISTLRIYILGHKLGHTICRFCKGESIEILYSNIVRHLVNEQHTKTLCASFLIFLIHSGFGLELFFSDERRFFSWAGALKTKERF